MTIRFCVVFLCDDTVRWNADDAHRSTTQRSQAIHHKAPVKVAVVEVSTSKSAERKHHKKKKGTKPTASTTIHHHHHHEEDDDGNVVHQKGHKGKGVKKYKIKGLKKLRKYMLPLLLAYKLKFFTLVPLLLGGLILIVASTGFAGFFFALFAVGVGLKKD
ncbi:hypothetical protein GE061_014612 [Apolygus lucorum]|uniref:Uncharacterized protein n=1 Tax=Apolygus lucorum TaxID=248454 RepID=A0A8S9XII4_APOLU|nr:hypothetical protein GE061_014612 [Apolygus lucorum]